MARLIGSAYPVLIPAPVSPPCWVLPRMATGRLRRQERYNRHAAVIGRERWCWKRSLTPPRAALPWWIAWPPTRQLPLPGAQRGRAARPGADAHGADAAFRLWIDRAPGYGKFLAVSWPSQGPDAVRITTTVPLRGEDMHTVAEFYRLRGTGNPLRAALAPFQRRALSRH